MTPPLTRIENAGADVILMVANAPEGAAIVNSMAERPIRLPIIAHWGITGGYFWQNTKEALKQVDLKVLQTFSFLTRDEALPRTLIQRYAENYRIGHPGEIFSPVGTAHAYDLIHLLAIAIAKAGTTDRSSVRTALEQISSYQGLLKHYHPPFTQERHDALDKHDFILATYNDKGYIVPIDQ